MMVKMQHGTTSNLQYKQMFMTVNDTTQPHTGETIILIGGGLVDF